MKPYILLLLLVFTNAAFARKIPDIQSAWTNNKDFPANFKITDKKSDISIGIQNDDKFIYLSLETKNIDLQKALIKSGFTLYFDTIKHKYKSNYLRYAHEMKKPLPHGKDLPVGSTAFNHNQGSPDLNAAYSKAIWKDIPYDLVMQKTVFFASHKMDASGSLIIQALIPVHIINRNGIDAIQHLAIGIDIFEGSHSKEGGGRRPTKYSTNGMPSSQSGMSRRGGGSGTGQGRGGGSGMKGGRQPIPQASSPKRMAGFWFNVFLSISE